MSVDRYIGEEYNKGKNECYLWGKMKVTIGLKQYILIITGVVLIVMAAPGVYMWMTWEGWTGLPQRFTLADGQKLKVTIHKDGGSFWVNRILVHPSNRGSIEGAINEIGVLYNSVVREWHYLD